MRVMKTKTRKKIFSLDSRPLDSNFIYFWLSWINCPFCNYMFQYGWFDIELDSFNQEYATCPNCCQYLGQEALDTNGLDAITLLEYPVYCKSIMIQHRSYYLQKNDPRGLNRYDHIVREDKVQRKQIGDQRPW